MKKPNLRARAARRNGKLGGRPAGEATKQIRVYAADVPKLKGKTQAESVRRLLNKEPHA